MSSHSFDSFGTSKKNSRFMKTVGLYPDCVSAGDSVEFVIRLEVDSSLDVRGGCLVYDLPATLGFSRPSCYDQEDDGYVEVFCSNPQVRYQKQVFDMECQRFGNKVNASFKGMAQRLFVLSFLEGVLHPGDLIEMHWGYVRNGFGCGTKVTTLVPYPGYAAFIHLRWFIDASRALPDLGRDVTGIARPMADEVVELACIVKTREPERIRVLRQAKRTSVLLLDRFANTCRVDDISTFVQTSIEGTWNDHGVYVLPSADAQVRSLNLPLSDSPCMQDVFEGYSVFFGDLHTHSAFSNDAIEREKMQMDPSRMYAFAQDSACVDFLCITDHHQPWDSERNKIGNHHWQQTLDAADHYDQAGNFLAFTGFEFRCPRGDTTVVCKDSLPYTLIDDPSLVGVKQLWDRLCEQKGIITMFHFHNPGQLSENQWIDCPYEGMEPVLEVYSCHGSYEGESVLERHVPQIKVLRKDRTARWFLDTGRRLGFVCNSDGHKGNPGCNGLTAVYAKNLDKESILQAIRERHVYGTTNARIRLLFTANGSLMGSEVHSADSMVRFVISVSGEAQLKSVILLCNGEPWRTWSMPGLELEAVEDVWRCPLSNWYVRVTQVDNHIAYSSPVWIV